MALERFKAWMKAATAKDKREFCRRAGLAVGTLYQIGYDDPLNGRNPSVPLAQKMDEAAREMHRISQKRLPLFTCADFDTPCNNCRYYNSYKGNK